MRKGNRLLLILTGILGLCAAVLLLLVSVFRVESLTIIEQNTELIYQSSSAEMMGFEFSYLSAQDEPKTVAAMRFVARYFPVYVIGRTTQSFGPFEVTTVQAVIAPMDTEWPESGGLDLSDAILTFTDGSEEQIRLGKLKLVPKEKNEGPYEITEMTSKDDGSFTIRLNATKMLHFASISSTTTENVLDVLELIINDKPVEEWKGLLVPQGEIVIQGSFKDKTVDPLQSMRLSPTMVLEDEKGNPFDLQFSTQRKRQEGFNVFNLLSTTRKGGSE